MDRISWSTYFMGVALITSFRSEDPNTKVGAILVTPDNKIIGTGYNGFIRESLPDEFPWKRTGNYFETKYAYVVHAESNCILNTTIHDLTNCTMFCTLHPCNECTKQIVQKGIKEVVYLDTKYDHTNACVASRRIASNRTKITHLDLNTKEMFDTFNGML